MANRTSVDSIILPLGMFREFQITAPAGQDPTGSNDPTYYPVWITRAELIASDQLRLFFATHATTDALVEAAPSLAAIEFATLDLFKSGVPGDRLAITPFHNLKVQVGANSGEFMQHFGRGHVVLSGLWDMTNNQPILDLYTAMGQILASPQDTIFSATSTRIGSFGISSVPQYSPTVGQARALTGSTGRLSVPIPPDESNRFVTELDQGLGDTIDLESITGINPHPAIERYGFNGGVCHKTIKMVIDATQLPTDPNFYDNVVLPRLRVLFGRDPQFGDQWFDGTRFRIHTGDAWQTP